jgi:hypothetical protein
MEHAKPMLRRCAIYTRKSSEEGLEQNFNSLHAQQNASLYRTQAGREKVAWDFNDSAAFYETKALCYRLSRSPGIDRTRRRRGQIGQPVPSNKFLSFLRRSLVIHSWNSGVRPCLS